MPERGHAEGMLCPACRVALVMSERKGIEIHYCPQCRGVWLDRGELDKIIERSLGEAAPAQAAPPPQYSPQQHGGGHPGGYGYGKPYKRRKSWLEEIFD